jgi:MFS family permease
MHRRVAFLLFAAGWGANHFAALLVVYAKELGLSPSALAVLFGGYALGLVPGLVLAGHASDTRGRRALVLPASALAVVASAVLAFGTHGFAVLLAGRLMFGLAMGCVMSPGSVWVQELSTAEQGPRRATLALSAGFGFGPLVSGAVAELAPAPMVVPYVLHAVVMTLALLGARSVSETAGTRASSPAPDDDDRPRGAARQGLVVLAGLSPVAPWAFGFAAIAIAIVPPLLRPHVPRPVLYSALVIATTLLSGVLVQPLTTRIGRRADLVGLGVGALGIVVAASAVDLASPGIVFGAAILLGAGYGLVMTTGLREIAERVPKRGRGTVVGVYYVLTYVGFALPFVHAVLAKRGGDVGTLYAAAGAAIASLLVRAIVASRRP